MIAMVGASAGSGVAFAIAAACVFAMGLAIQRGATCAVAAVEEMVEQQRLSRLAAMLEASLWVAGGLALAQLLELLPATPPAYSIGGETVLGGLLLGLGAWVNGACVFGAIARFGSGHWVYALTPLGYFLGCLGFGRAMPHYAAMPIDSASPLQGSAAAVAALFVAFALWRLHRGWPRRGGEAAPVSLARRLGTRIATPHAATVGIGITFVLTLLLSGPWTYTELLHDLARGIDADIGARLLLFAALLLGAVCGGWKHPRGTPPTPAQAARCLAGGAMMGAGTLLIPGANDGLILVGLPLLQPHAWLAFATMCASIAAALLAQRAWARRSFAGAARS